MLDSSKRVLLTGGNGFLGSFVKEKLIDQGVLEENIIIPKSRDLDLRIKQNCAKTVQGIDIVIHLAANVGGIGLNQEKPGDLFYDNLIMGVQLMEEARLAEVEKFVAVGTICAYPKFTPIPFKEEDLWNGYPEETNAPYGLAKKMLLVQAQAYRQQYNFNAIFLLPVNLYGPKDNFNPNSSHVIPALIKKIADAKKSKQGYIECWGDGSPTREFLYVEDAAEAIVMAADEYDESEPVNLGSGMEISIKDLVEKIAKIMKFEGEIKWDTTKPNGQPRRCLDTSKATDKFGFKAQTKFDEGLKKTILWYLEEGKFLLAKNKNNKLSMYFDDLSDQLPKWRKRNKYYYDDLNNLMDFLIPEDARVLEIGCAHGDLLASLKNKNKVGVDISPEMISRAKQKYSDIDFRVMSAEKLQISEKFDYVVMSNTVGYLDDIQKAFKNLNNVVKPDSKIIVTYYNFLWEPILKLAEKFGLRMKDPGHQNWLNNDDIANILYNAGFEVIKKGQRLLFPKNIPLFSTLMNKYIGNLPLIRRLCITNYLVARPIPDEVPGQEYSVSVVVPARDEKGNIENAILRTPSMGKWTEIIFVEGNSTDGTWEEIKRVYNKYKDTRKMKIMQQDGKGKGDAVRKAYDHAEGDILMILDADLTVPPEDLAKFYHALATRKGEFINGTRLVYQMDKQAMRFLNMLGNKFFSWMFTWLLDQRFKDTLCGTKVMFKWDYEKLARGRKYFGDFDPYGDFDLLFGASKLNLKIVEIPIRYKERTYGDTSISRFQGGWLLLRMCLFAAKKIKFR